MTNFQSYKIHQPPNDFQHCQMHPRESEYQFISDNERAGNRACPGGTDILGHRGTCDYDGQEGHCMDRACQSSLPSVASECIHSPHYKNRQEMGRSNQPMNIAIDGYHRNADSPVSDMGPEYAGESTEAGETTDGDFPVIAKVEGHLDSNDVSAGGEPWATMTDQCNTEDSCDESESGNSSDGSFLNEADFASAVAKAAELSGLTVEGTTISDPKAKQQVRRQRRHHRPRPTSPYSTDSNFSEVVRKPYPKSQRKKQLAEQGGIRGNRKEHNPQMFQQRYPPPTGEEPPSYYKPNFPVQDQSKMKSKGPALPPTSKDSGINLEPTTKDYLRQILRLILTAPLFIAVFYEEKKFMNNTRNVTGNETRPMLSPAQPSPAQRAHPMFKIMP
ncbi:hypothetical protein FSP39_014523 [Pinctada imbricata]|uniref:Uncharacterized protein n=1 Tax=Pinctada imbricata TaxID=66713 RepID=A0AA89CDD3_PINIB|nr:hypothetical protein FSP39_014523 [Pinctada imbricata]